MTESQAKLKRARNHWTWVSVGYQMKAARMEAELVERREFLMRPIAPAKGPRHA